MMSNVTSFPNRAFASAMEERAQGQQKTPPFVRTGKKNPRPTSVTGVLVSFDHAYPYLSSKAVGV